MVTSTIPLTQDDGEAIWIDWLKAIVVGLVVAAIVFLGTIGWLTLQNTYAVVHGHNSELSQLKTDETTVVRIGTYLGNTQHTICLGLHLTCPPPP